MPASRPMLASTRTMAAWSFTCMSRTTLPALILSTWCRGVRTGNSKASLLTLTPTLFSALLSKHCAYHRVCHEHYRCFRVLALFNSTQARSRVTYASLEHKRLSSLPAFPHCVHCVHTCHAFGCILLIRSGCRYAFVNGFRYYKRTTLPMKVIML